MQKIYKIIKMHSCFDSIKPQNLRIGYAKGKSLKKRMHPFINILITKIIQNSILHAP
jgi:hypothetical protein